MGCEGGAGGWSGVCKVVVMSILLLCSIWWDAVSGASQASSCKLLSGMLSM